MSDSDPRAIEALEAAVRADPGAEGFPELAEHQRRAGRLARAEEIATRGLERRPDSPRGRAVLLLVLADAGRSDEMRRRLESWVGDAPPPAPAAMLFPEAEFEQAFEAAEPELDAMITPDSVAEEAALRADGDFAMRSPLETSGAFTTRTMADLLERQGDVEGAARIRATLGAPRTPHPATRSADAATLATLERWLANARSMQS